MRGLLVLVIAMAVLIVAGVATIAVTIMHRIGAVSPPPADIRASLDEPTGTKIAAVSGLGDRLAITLQGGGPDRVLIFNLSTGQRSAEIRLAR